jgi:hypothetical protein
MSLTLAYIICKIKNILRFNVGRALTPPDRLEIDATFELSPLSVREGKSTQVTKDAGLAQGVSGC